MKLYKTLRIDSKALTKRTGAIEPHATPDRVHCPMILLPGLDGSDLLLERFRERAPDGHDVTILPLPNRASHSYQSLCDYFSERIVKSGSCHLVAESFSGPLGILLAQRHPDIVQHLTLVATFARSPAPVIAKAIPWSVVFRIPMPTHVAQYFLTGPNDTLAKELQRAIRQTPTSTLVARMHCVMNVDVTTELSELGCGLTYIRPRQDRIIQNSAIATISLANPDVTIREIDGPHLILQAHPRQAWEAILRPTSSNPKKR